MNLLSCMPNVLLLQKMILNEKKKTACAMTPYKIDD